jgi:hypothetical protein
MAHMDLARYIETLHRQLVAAAESGGPEGRAAVERLLPGLESAVRVVLLEVLSSAADEITREMAPGSVEVRLRGSDPDFVVNLPSLESAAVDTFIVGTTSTTVIDVGEDDGGTSRLNLRLPEGLKGRIEEASRREGLSLNAWLVRSAAAALERTAASTPSRTGRQTFTGWVQ